MREERERGEKFHLSITIKPTHDRKTAHDAFFSAGLLSF